MCTSLVLKVLGLFLRGGFCVVSLLSRLYFSSLSLGMSLSCFFSLSNIAHQPITHTLTLSVHFLCRSRLVSYLCLTLAHSGLALRTIFPEPKLFTYQGVLLNNTFPREFTHQLLTIFSFLYYISNGSHRNMGLQKTNLWPILCYLNL